jgi:hypothetical protein
MKCARKTRWHSSPESVPYAHTFACWLLSASANLYFIASRMRHKNAQMAYGAQTEAMNQDRAVTGNDRFSLVDLVCPRRAPDASREKK